MTLELKKLDEQKNRNLNDIINDRKKLDAIEKLILNINFSVTDKKVKVNENNMNLNNIENESKPDEIFGYRCSYLGGPELHRLIFDGKRVFFGSTKMLSNSKQANSYESIGIT